MMDRCRSTTRPILPLTAFDAPAFALYVVKSPKSAALPVVDKSNIIYSIILHWIYNLHHPTYHELVRCTPC